MNRNLNDIIEEFEELRGTYRAFIRNSELNRDSLMEFQGRFNDLKADLRPHHAEVSRQYTTRDDKAATAIKYRLAVSISKGDHEDFESCSINQAEKFAPASKEYKKFLEQRAFWKESLVNINDLRDDISSYLIEISTRLR
jgi:hypothetical protein